MKIYLIMNVRFPTEKAHGWQIAKMCEAFLALGHDATLVIPDRKNPIKQSAKEYYGLDAEIPVIRLPVLDFLSSALGKSRPIFFLMEWTFIRSVRQWAKRQTDAPAFVLTRDQFLAERFSHSSWKLALEIHDVAQGFFEKHRRLVEHVDLFVMTNAWKKKEALRLWGDSVKNAMLVLPNAIDVAPYLHLPSKQEARKKLAWDDALSYAVYTGHFYGWKGASTLVEAAKNLPEHFRTVLIGGTEEDFAKMRAYVDAQHLKTVMLVPHVPQAEVKTYLAAADCLVLPNSGKSWHSRFTTSPIKLWEYLAAKRPVVASDLPAIRELVTEKEVRFVSPDNPPVLAEAIQQAVRGDDARVQAGFELASANTWTMRANKLIKAFQAL